MCSRLLGADYVVTMDSTFSPQSVSLKINQNNVKLISLITAHLWEPIRQLLFGEQYVIVLGLDEKPFKMSAVDLDPEKYATLRNSHEEADTLMIQHVNECANLML